MIPVAGKAQPETSDEHVTTASKQSSIATKQSSLNQHSKGGYEIQTSNGKVEGGDQVDTKEG